MTSKEYMQKELKELEDLLERTKKECDEKNIYIETIQKHIKQTKQVLKDLEILEILKEECQVGIDKYGKGTWGWVEFDLGYEDEFDKEGTKKMKKLRKWLKKNDK